MCAFTLNQMPTRPAMMFKLLKEAERLGISEGKYSDANHFTNQAMHAARDLFAQGDAKNTNVIYTSICAEDAMRELHSIGCEGETKRKNRDNVFDGEEFWAGYYKVTGKCMSYRQEDLEEHVAECMHRREPVFIFMDIVDYSVFKNKKGVVEEETHSVCVIMVPEGELRYRFMYFNSHGVAIEDYDTFDFANEENDVIETLKYSRSAEFIFMRELADFFQNTYNYVYSDWLEKKQMVVAYEETAGYNYLGANLQECDSYGVCFSFPIIVFLNFVRNYDAPRNIEATVFTQTSKAETNQYTLPAYKVMFANEYFTEAVTSMFMGFSKEITRLYFVYMSEINGNNYNVACEKTELRCDLTNDVTCTMDEEKIMYLKVVLNNLIDLINQPKMVETIKTYM